MSSFVSTSSSFASVGEFDWHENTLECAICNGTFNMFKRRHHCRKCGRCVCSACSPSKIQLEGYLRSQRVCSPCIGLSIRRASLPAVFETMPIADVDAETEGAPEAARAHTAAPVPKAGPVPTVTLASLAVPPSADVAFDRLAADSAAASAAVEAAAVESVTEGERVPSKAWVGSATSAGLAPAAEQSWSSASDVKAPSVAVGLHGGPLRKKNSCCREVEAELRKAHEWSIEFSLRLQSLSGQQVNVEAYSLSPRKTERSTSFASVNLEQSFAMCEASLPHLADSLHQLAKLRQSATQVKDAASKEVLRPTNDSEEYEYAEVQRLRDELRDEVRRSTQKAEDAQMELQTAHAAMASISTHLCAVAFVVPPQAGAGSQSVNAFLRTCDGALRAIEEGREQSQTASPQPKQTGNVVRSPARSTRERTHSDRMGYARSDPRDDI